MGNRIPFDKILQVTQLASEVTSVAVETEDTHNLDNEMDNEGEDSAENQLALF